MLIKQHKECVPIFKNIKLFHVHRCILTQNSKNPIATVSYFTDKCLKLLMNVSSWTLVSKIGK